MTISQLLLITDWFVQPFILKTVCVFHLFVLWSSVFLFVFICLKHPANKKKITSLTCDGWMDG